MKIKNYSIWTIERSELENPAIHEIAAEGVNKGLSLLIYNGELYCIFKFGDFSVYEKLNVDFEL